VPRVVGLGLAKAKSKIRARHCTTRVTKKRSTRRKMGKVLSQAPKPGKRLKRGARVTVVVGKGPKK